MEIVDTADANRYRWLKNYMQVTRGDSDWTCWLELKCIPFRSLEEDPEKLLDQLMERFPLNTLEEQRKRDEYLIREAIRYGQLADDMPYQLPKPVRDAIKRCFE